MMQPIAALLLGLSTLAGRPFAPEAEPEPTPAPRHEPEVPGPASASGRVSREETPADPAPEPTREPDGPAAQPEPATPAAVASPPAASAGTARTSGYRIGPEDVIRVRVIDRPEFDASATVSERRTLLLPVLGEVDVAGLTPDELREKLRRRLAAEYVRSPQVVVDVVEYNNMKVWVFGWVKSPGELRLTGPTTILELLSLVGNAKANAGSKVTIERTTTHQVAGPGGAPIEVAEADTLEVDLDALLHQGDLSQNVELRNGDKIYVPPSTAKVYMLGEVTKPGFYPYTEGMTLSDLVQMAGGLTDFANPKKVLIRREGLKSPIKVNFKAFMKDGDLERNAPLQEGDVVIVNSSFLF